MTAGAVKSDVTLPTPPDGGWGWAVVIGSFLIHVVADGVAYSFGVFVVALAEQYTDAGRSALGWIGSIMVGVTLSSGPLASALTNRFGCRLITIVGTLIAALGFFISAFVTNIYVLYFTVGVIGGLGLGLIYLPAIVILSYYFEKRRAFATGLAVCGSGVGTFLFAPLAQWLVSNYGWQGAMLIESAILLNCCISGALFRPVEPVPGKKPLADQADSGAVVDSGDHVLSAIPGDVRHDVALKEPGLSGSTSSLRSRKSARHEDKPHGEAVATAALRKDAFYTGSLHNIPLYREDPQHFTQSMMSIHKAGDPKDHGEVASVKQAQPWWMEIVSVFDPEILTDPLFQLFAWSNFLTNLTFFIPFMFLPDRAVINGVHEGKAALLLSFIGAFNMAGRILFGFIADHLGRRRIFLYFTVLTLCGVVTCLSTLSNKYIFLAIYAALYGLLLGVQVTLTPVMIVDLLGLDKLSNAFGIVLLYQGVATVIGPPFAGFLYDKTGSYSAAFMVFGIMIGLSGVILYPVPWIQRRRNKRNPPTEIDIKMGVQAGDSQDPSLLQVKKLHEQL